MWHSPCRTSSILSMAALQAGGGRQAAVVGGGGGGGNELATPTGQCGTIMKSRASCRQSGSAGERAEGRGQSWAGVARVAGNWAGGKRCGDSAEAADVPWIAARNFDERCKPAVQGREDNPSGAHTRPSCASMGSSNEHDQQPGVGSLPAQPTEALLQQEPSDLQPLLLSQRSSLSVASPRDELAADGSKAEAALPPDGGDGSSGGGGGGFPSPRQFAQVSLAVLLIRRLGLARRRLEALNRFSGPSQPDAATGIAAGRPAAAHRTC